MTEQKCGVKRGWKVLGITGGVGAGKSTVLAYMEERYQAKIFECDAIAASLQKPGGSCYIPMLELLGREVLRRDGCLDRAKVAERVFREPEMLRKLNAIVHPAVKQFVLKQIAHTRREGATPLIVIEAALLLEDDYGAICDEIWYIHAEETVRRRRLRESRGYSDEKITQIMRAQKSEVYFREHCQFTVDNSSDNVENTYGQIDKGLKTHGFL